MDSDPAPRARQLGGELVIPVLAVVFTLYFFSTIIHSPWTAQVSAFALGGILLLVCAIFFVRCALWLRRGEGTLSMGNLVGRDDLATGRVGLAATTLGFCLFIDDLGFTLTTFLFLFLSFLILARGAHPLRSGVVAAVLALSGWALFIWAFDTRFPRGWFEETMRAVLNG